MFSFTFISLILHVTNSQDSPFLPGLQGMCKATKDNSACMIRTAKEVAPVLVRNLNCDSDTNCDEALESSYEDACSDDSDATPTQKLERATKCRGFDRIIGLFDKYERILKASGLAYLSRFQEDKVNSYTKTTQNNFLESLRKINSQNKVKSFQLVFLSLDQIVTMRAEIRLLSVRLENSMNQLFSVGIASLVISFLLCAVYSAVISIFVYRQCRNFYESRQLEQAIAMDRKLDAYYIKREQRQIARAARRNANADNNLNQIEASALCS